MEKLGLWFGALFKVLQCQQVSYGLNDKFRFYDFDLRCMGTWLWGLLTRGVRDSTKRDGVGSTTMAGSARGGGQDGVRNVREDNRKGGHWSGSVR